MSGTSTHSASEWDRERERERERERGQHEFSIFQLYPQGHEDEGEVALNLVHHYFDKLLAFMHEISPL